MQTLRSDYFPLCAVALPYQGRQKYMHTFNLAAPTMALGFEDYLEPVLKLCRTAGAFFGLAHMTVDEKMVQPGMSQRRPGPHVDGCFVPSQKSWEHGPAPGWNHYCNHLSGQAVARMPVIVASSAVGCKVWRGEFQADPTGSGDLSHISDKLGMGEIVPPNVGYLLSADCIHESMIMKESIRRSFLRIALPVDFQIALPEGA